MEGVPLSQLSTIVNMITRSHHHLLRKVLPRTEGKESIVGGLKNIEVQVIVDSSASRNAMETPLGKSDMKYPLVMTNIAMV